MPSPVNDSYSVASGVTMYAGRYAPVITGALGVALAGMSSNTLLDFTSTNVNVLVSAGCPDGDTAAFETNTAGQTIQPWSGKGWFSGSLGLIGMVGTAQGYSSGDFGAHTKRVLWDLMANAFSQLFSPFGNGGGGHMYDRNVSVPLNNIVYTRGYNDPKMCAENLVTGTRYTEFTSTLTDQIIGLDVLPNMGAQGTLVQIGESGKLYTYDLATKVETNRGTKSGIGSNPVCIYVPGGDFVVFGAGVGSTTLYQMTNAGVVTAITQTLPASLAIAASYAVAGTYGPTVAHPGGHASIIVFSASLNAAYEMVITGGGSPVGTWSKLADLTGIAGSGAMDITCAVAVHGAAGVALFKAGGRTSAPVMQQCKIILFKV
jgi:hypothetical protein